MCRISCGFNRKISRISQSLFLVLIVSSLSLSAQHQNNRSFEKVVSGVITNDSQPLSGVIITDTEGKKQVTSEKNGSYKIETTVGSTIRYRYKGLQTVDVIVEDVTNELNLKMRASINRLDEVVVTSSNVRSKIKGVDIKPKVIENTFGSLNLRAAGYPISVVDGRNLNEIYVGQNNLSTALFGKFIQFRNPQAINIRPNILWDVDGMLSFREPTNINFQDIEYVAQIRSLAGLVRYGTFGNGGVIVVRTKKGLQSNAINSKFFNDKFYQGDARPKDAISSTLTYINAIKKCSSVKSLNDYLDQEGVRDKRDPWLYLSAANHANKVLKDISTMLNCLDRAEMLADKNPEVLKAIAYQYQQKKMNAKAIQLFNNVAYLRPNYAQSYRDLANAYADHQQYLMAWRTYMSYLYHGNTLGDNGIGKIMYREMQALRFLHNDKIRSKEKFTMPKNLDNISNDVRFVFEWSSGEAEFDLEFVSDDNRSYAWKHDFLRNKERIVNEKKIGYSSQEFVIDKLNFDENWLVNLTYYGNKTDKPCLLKMSVFHNWGTTGQKEKIYTYLLDKQDVKVNLLGFKQISKEGLPQQLETLVSSKHNP
ncbi:carboxypeptidase-like regulatory domain-containing protein [Spongiivirga citrea]|uniref:TonB-dependent receptor plug domain-containing protein n=1 Tax=Spongiivirga citrea TaxID=1481457 RepID=A0A6M0CM36_9FLAO|nr:hypothetical protein [Spongiivirga citrea]NER18023.1 hypothetical protein [Spongiivirga citrea]